MYIYIYIYIHTHTDMSIQDIGLAVPARRLGPQLGLPEPTSAGASLASFEQHDILYYTTLHYTLLYYTILYYTILYYTILYYTVVTIQYKYHNVIDIV